MLENSITNYEDTTDLMFSWYNDKSNTSKTANSITILKCKERHYIAYLIPKIALYKENIDYSGEYKYLKDTNGIYFLFGESEDKNIKNVYVGESVQSDTSNGIDKIILHANNEKESYFEL